MRFLLEEDEAGPTDRHRPRPAVPRRPNRLHLLAEPSLRSFPRLLASVGTELAAARACLRRMYCTPNRVKGWPG